MPDNLLIDTLRARYAEPHRAYHGQRHIDLLLAQFCDIRQRLHDPEAVELAIWYHDAIYDPLSKTNEADSAALLLAERHGDTAAATLTRGHALILATANHMLPPGLGPEDAADCAHFLDMDLSILGADPATFAWYTAAIRQEYRAVPEAEWKMRRPHILRGFLGRPRLFLTDHFHAKLDLPARRNLAAAIQEFA